MTAIAAVYGFILLVGASNLLPELLAQIETHAVRGTRITVLEPKPPSELESRALAGRRESFSNIEIEFVEGDPASAGAYEELSGEGEYMADFGNGRVSYAGEVVES